MQKEQAQYPYKEGTLRLMTPGEITMARCVFGNHIIYHRVWIHNDSYFPFGLQGKRVAMSPNGEVWFRKEYYHPDFSSGFVDERLKHNFIHESGHIWQHQHGQGQGPGGYLVGRHIIFTLLINRDSPITPLNNKPVLLLITG